MKITFRKIKIWFEKLPKILAEQAFFSVLILIFLALILGGILVYKYGILAQRVEPEILAKPPQFKKTLYQKILERYTEREKIFEKTKTKQYPDLFRKTFSK